jgi:hypothetical protein
VFRDEIVEGLAQPAIGDLRRLDASEHFELDGGEIRQPDRFPRKLGNTGLTCAVASPYLVRGTVGEALGEA